MDLNQTEIALLGEAQRSNGGGIRCLPSNGKVIGKLMQAGLLVPKKGNVTSVELYVITRAGRTALQDHAERAAGSVQSPEVFRNVVDHVERLNQQRPEVVVLGARQVGKTEALRQLIEQGPPHTPPFPDATVIDVEFKEVKTAPPWNE